MAVFGSGSILLAAALAALPATAGAEVVKGAVTAESRQEAKQLLVSESFTGTSIGDANFSSIDACLTAATELVGVNAFDSCADQSVGSPPVGKQPGYLQLTDQQQYQAGAIVYNAPLPAADGIEVTFAQYQYGGTGADGISFFIVDGETDLTEPGAMGGSLGYAQRNLPGNENPTADGIDGGYLGLGLDSWGNFSADTEGRGNGCTEEEGLAPPHLRVPFNRAPDNVALRGPGQGQDGYCLIATSATDEQIGSYPNGALYGSSFPEHLNTDSLETAKRLVKLKVIDTDGDAKVTVDLKFVGDGVEEQDMTWQRVLEATVPEQMPETFKFGFAASTGGSTDVHLIRHLRVSTLDQ